MRLAVALVLLCGLLPLLQPALAAQAGDVDANGVTDLSDVLAMTRFAILGEPQADQRVIDVDGSGTPDLDDSLYLLRWLCGEPLYLHVPEISEVTFEDKLTVPADSEYVDFGSCTVDDWSDVAPFLRQLPKLRRCDMYASVIRAPEIEALAAEFPQVEFGWSMLVAECWMNGHGHTDHIVRTDAEVFSTLHYSNSPMHTSADFQVLRFCKRLKALDIGHNRLNDISFLSGLTELRVLIVAVTLGVDDISPLANLTRLQYLELFHNRISDISPLQNLTDLRDLNLSQNAITDYTPLYGLSRLERLWLWNSNNPTSENATVPYTLVSELQEHLPGCTIGGWRDYGATNGTWRTDPHYEVIHRIFTGGVYEPF